LSNRRAKWDFEHELPEVCKSQVHCKLEGKWPFVKWDNGTGFEFVVQYIWQRTGSSGRLL